MRAGLSHSRELVKGQRGAILQVMKRFLIPFLIAASPALSDGIYNGKTVDCYCTDQGGGRIELGEMICLHVDGRSFMAQCQMSLNNPMWLDHAALRGRMPVILPRRAA